ncbi:uncharacterized protein A4U43_C07F9170 [Asparagus officinalis]|uniref:Uncharacterized protein n=1 Tax=Asparagus officinalis TaxID=4686 RepID=A0A5P1EAK1_ASPOF|nr:uncharacterized protein A4U43_C07F9170 [Asparagus officinalis]
MALLVEDTIGLSSAPESSHHPRKDPVGSIGDMEGRAGTPSGHEDGVSVRPMRLWPRHHDMSEITPASREVAQAMLMGVPWRPYSPRRESLRVDLICATKGTEAWVQKLK